MHSAVIPSVHSYPALRLAPQQVHQRYVHPGPLVLGTNPLNSPTPTADRDRTVSRRSEPSSRTNFNRRTAEPLGPSPAPGCDEPTSRCQTMPSIWTSWASSACYPRRTFYPLSDGPSTRDHRITMTDFRLCSTCCLAVRQAYAIALNERFPTALSPPSRASVTLWEATAPVKLPTMHCPGSG